MIIPRLAGLLFCSVFIAYGYFAQDIQLDFWAEEELFNARTFPTLIALGGAVVSLLYVIYPTRITWPPPDLKDSLSPPDWLATALLVLTMIGYGHLLDLLGFLPATIGLLAAGFIILGERRASLLIVTSVGLPVLFYTLITLLGIHLESGIPAALHWGS